MAARAGPEQPHPNPNSSANLLPFLPTDRRIALAQNRELSPEQSGSVLFSDISGFVALTVGFCELEGARGGAERIAAQLNRCFELIIAVVHAHGGHVISFAGDAISCFFPNDAGGRACAAAVQIREDFARLPPLQLGDEAFQLQVKSAITAGTVFRFAAGMPRFQRLDVMTGEAAQRNAIAACHINADDILIGEEVCAALPVGTQTGPPIDAGGLQFHPLLGGSQCEPSPIELISELPDEVCRQWVHPEVRARLVRLGIENYAEMRPCGSLFLRFEGLALTQGTSNVEAFDAVVRAAQLRLEHHGGHIVQVSTGEKGDFLFAVFGAPSGRGKEPHKMLQAAQDLLQLPRVLTQLESVHIGMGYGLSWCGAYGASSRRHFGIQGRQVNLAARLMQRAEPGQILVSEPLVSAAEAAAHFRSVGHLSLKGEGSCEVYEAQRPAADELARVYSWHGRLIGREFERQQLQQFIGDLGAELKAARLILEGEAGIGKSRLISFALELATRNERLETAIAILEPGHRESAYAAWLQILTRLAGVESLDGAGLARWMQKRLPDTPASHGALGLLNQFLPMGLTLPAAYQGLLPARQRQLISALIRDLLQGLGTEQPLLLVFEDVHWMDAESWETLLELDRSAVPLALLLSSRPVDGPTHSSWQTFRERHAQARIELATMPDSQIAELVAQRLGIDELPPTVLQGILARSGGNPYFSEEIGLALRDQGLLHSASGGTHIDAAQAHAALQRLPLTVEAVVQGRIDLLGEAQQLCLKAASVLGRSFSASALLAVHPGECSLTWLRAQLDALEALDITPIESHQPELRYRFLHAITHEVAYARMPEAQRAPIHLRALRWYENSYPAEQLLPHLPIVARHAQRSGDTRLALDYLERAAEHAVITAGSSEALGFLNDLIALDAAQAQPSGVLQRARWLAWRSNAYEIAGQLQHSLHDAEEITRLFGRRTPRGTLSLILATLGPVLRHLSRALIGRQSRPAAPQHHARLKILYQAYLRQSEVHYQQEDVLYSLFTTLCSLDTAQGLGPGPELVMAYTDIGSIAQFFTPQRVQRHFRQARERCMEAIGMQELEGPATLVREGLMCLGRGELQRARRLLDLALTEADRIGHRPESARALRLCRVIAILQCDLSRARNLTERMARELLGSEAAAEAENQVVIAHQRASAAILAGDSEKAQPALDVLHELSRGDAPISSQRQVWSLLARGQHALMRGDFPAAQACAREILALLPLALPYVSPLLDAYAFPAEVCLRQWEDQGGRGQPWHECWYALYALRAFARRFPLGRSRYALMRGRLAVCRGNREAGRARLQAALQTINPADLPYDHALLLLALAQSWPAGSTERRATAQQAQAAFVALGAAPAAQRARALQVAQ